MGATSVYSLPFPEPSDAPNGPTQIEALAEAIEDTLQGPFAFGGAVDVPGNIELGGSLDMGGRLDVAGHVRFTHADLQPQQTASDTDITGVTSTTPAAGSPQVGIAFQGPPSGMVYVTVTGRVRSHIDGNLAILSWEMKTGSTIGSGTAVPGASANANRAILTGEAVNTGSPAEACASNRLLVLGLTPDADYNVRTMHWSSVSGQSSDYLYRAILVEPVL